MKSMKSIGLNDELKNFLRSKKISLISSQLLQINIFVQDFLLCVEVYLSVTGSKETHQIKLKFSDVKEYSFYHGSESYFYNVEIVKFFSQNDLIYISFDPHDEEEIISPEDQDCILGKNVEGFLISDDRA